ncbi:hypothetical protein BSF41_08780 [Flavobacterium sp. ACN2]|uniref:hypothetical protein n=1 Tax=Flavobacterium sp. ACN2 TaxID=1975676 RepID=UPI000BB3CC16|nr:hypothetical protein [Flavobacterium sp. ACN2]PBI92396.1 hypothetical protein BSF41_08780 [Flavobacterium sp. ACN2]
MKFKLLTLEVTSLADLPANAIPFRFKVYFIKEIFMAFLPAIEINNSSKIEITFGPKGNDNEFDGALGCTNVYIEDFNFKEFYNYNLEKQQNEILEIIVFQLIKLIEKQGKNFVLTDIIRETAKRVIESKFDLKISIKRLSKITPNKLYKINVYRCLNAKVGESWICEKENRKNKLIMESLMTKVPGFLYRRDFFKVAQISNTGYIVYNRFEIAVFNLNLQEL